VKLLHHNGASKFFLQQLLYDCSTIASIILSFFEFLLKTLDSVFVLLDDVVELDYFIALKLHLCTFLRLFWWGSFMA